MPLIGDLTRPENFGERLERRRILAIVQAAGGCPYCTKRGVQGWGMALCTVRDRSFPKCTTDGQAPAFELDEQQLRETP